MLGRKSSAFCDKLFDRVVETAFQLHIGTSWAEKLSDENLTFSCSDIERKVFTFVRMFFDWVVRTAFHLAIGLFWEEVSPLSFPHLFRTLSKKSSGFCRMFVNWVVTIASFLSRSVLCVEHLLQESCRVVYHFRTFRQKTFAFWQKNNAIFVKSACWLSIGKIWGEVFFGNLFWQFLEL